MRVKWTRAASCQSVPVPCSIVTTTSAPPALDFTDVHAKLDRAEEHINTLSDEIDAFVNGDSYGRFEARLNPIDESYSMIFHETNPYRSAGGAFSSAMRVTTCDALLTTSFARWYRRAKCTAGISSRSLTRRIRGTASWAARTAT